MEIVNSGLIYKNPKPHVKSIHSYFPSVVSMSNGEMLATIALGEAFESVDSHTYVCRSADNGENWTLEGRIYPGTPERLTSDYARLTYLGDGELVVFMVRSDRSEHPDEGLTNPKTLGFVPTELLLLRSNDFGRNWSEPQAIIAPLVGPSFEICAPITVLSDGRWVISTQTWPGWDGYCPSGIRMVGLVSYDKGYSWPEYMDIMHSDDREIYYWESKIIELSDGRLLAVAWAYDADAKRDLPNHFAISEDGGKNWSKPIATDLQGQTLTPYELSDGRILSVYRRMDRPGLWAALSRIDGYKWITEYQYPLWGQEIAGLTDTSENMSHNFNVLKFGAPCITRTPDGELFVAFWGYEQCVSVIRWFKLSIS